MNAEFRQAASGHRPLVGTFQKFPTHQSTELLGLAGFDFTVVDCEHAPIGSDSLDRIALASRAARIPALVRVTSVRDPLIGQALDMGFAGVLVPHVIDATDAERAVSAARFTGRRGMSSSPRAGEYGAWGMAEYRERSDAAVSVWCQIEDWEALENLGSIAEVEGVDALFIGPSDLSHSLGLDRSDDPAVAEAVAKIAAAARAADLPAAMYVGSLAQAEAAARAGVTIFVRGSDQSMLKAAATATCSELRASIETAAGG